MANLSKLLYKAPEMWLPVERGGGWRSSKNSQVFSHPTQKNGIENFKLLASKLHEGKALAESASLFFSLPSYTFTGHIEMDATSGHSGVRMFTSC
jgi:hypothetical protein